MGVVRVSVLLTSNEEEMSKENAQKASRYGLGILNGYLEQNWVCITSAIVEFAYGTMQIYTLFHPEISQAAIHKHEDESLGVGITTKVLSKNER